MSRPFPNFIKGISLKNMSDNFGAFLRVHRSPDNEESIANNTPMHFLDLYYLKNWSLVLDFYIIIRTFLVILVQKVD